MKVLDRIALVLVIIGALNWGAVGLFRFDCVAAIFGGQAACSAMHPPRRENNEKTAERRSFHISRIISSFSFSFLYACVPSFCAALHSHRWLRQTPSHTAPAATHSYSGKASHRPGI